MFIFRKIEVIIRAQLVFVNSLKPIKRTKDIPTENREKMTGGPTRIRVFSLAILSVVLKDNA